MQTKHLFLTAILLVFSMLVVAEPVDPMRALEVAEQFAPQSAKAKRIKSKTAPEQSYEIVYTHRMPNSDRAAFYVVKLGEKGFVIISADDVANPILGYSYTNSWPTSISAQGDTLLPPQVLSFLNDMALQIETAIEKYPNLESSEEWNNVGQKAVRKTSARKSADALPDSVGPLLTTTWGQGQYYNALCPEDAEGEDGHVPTGCVATAMAQIINYWGQKEEIKTRGIHSYDSQYGILSVNYDSTSYDFNNMPAALTAESTPEQVNAVAKLMYECGVAVNMLYNPWESASLNEDARAALINFYRFSPDLSIAERVYFSNVEWDNLLQNDIAQGKPVYYSGTQNNLGHSFVCDGYNATGYYHFNFGWGGLADGWYLTSAVSPNGMDFNSNQLVLVGIIPDNTSNVILGQTAGNSVFIVDESLELYHLLGHNAYEGTNYTNECNNNVLFKSADNATQLVLDILEHKDQNAIIYDGEWGTELRSLYAGQENDLSPVVSTNKALHINYFGNLYYSGFRFAISKDEGCRRVSNIVTSVDTTTVHLMWQENGTATQWEIEYGEKGFVLGNGIKAIVDATQYDIIGLKKFTEYDIYIRAVCDSDEYGLWSKTAVMCLAAYWTDVVTEQPNGYVISDDYSSVAIYTPEAFAWWAKQGCPLDAHLMADLDMSAYRWKPVVLFNRTLEGGGYSIKNLHIRETTNNVGLFSELFGISCVANLGLIDSYIKGEADNTGGLCGNAQGYIRNCYVRNSTIIGRDYTGGLIGSNQDCVVLNSYVNTFVSGMRHSGLFCGNLTQPQGIIHNCYAIGHYESRSYCYQGGIVAYAHYGTITNCYSVNTPMGVIGGVGECVVKDTSTILCSNSKWELVTPICFDEETTINLREALNYGVLNINDSIMRVWNDDVEGINGGFPVHGDNYSILCPNVKDLMFSNVIIEGRNALVVAWHDVGATSYEIRYRCQDKLNDSYIHIKTTHNVDTIYDIPIGFVYDFNVRAICEQSERSGWSPTQSFMVDKPYWTDFITSRPEGFNIDINGNIEISSAEGLAYLVILVNGLNGETHQTFSNKIINLVNDISLKGLRWMPIGTLEHPFSGVFNGNNYKISDLYINESYSSNIYNLGLFGRVKEGSVTNVILVSGEVNGHSSSGGSFESVGGVVGFAENCHLFKNCYSAVNVYGIQSVGSLFGTVLTKTTKPTSVINCSASGTVKGRTSCGGLIGDAFGINIMNSYAIGNVYRSNHTVNSWYRGGLIGNFMYSSAYNCYSIGDVEVGEDAGYVGSVIGCPYLYTHIQYLYGQRDTNIGLELIGNYCEDIVDTTQFIHNGHINSLLLPISIAGVPHTDLVDALNAWVVEQNNPTFKTWVTDSLTGYPVYGEYFVPSCYNPTDLVVTNATIIGDSTIRTQLSWHQEGEPIAWEILYVDTEQKIENGTIVQVNTNPCVLTDLPVGRPLDLYVRAICNDDDISSWSEPITYIPDKLRWTEVVTTQPEGYKEDKYGNIYISSAEGVAWLSSKANGLNGQKINSLNGHVIYLMNDIDLSQYRWIPIGISDYTSTYYVTLYGNNHSINGLYINELSENLGLFGIAHDLTVSNLNLHNYKLLGLHSIGAIVGMGYAVNVVNCALNGCVSGISNSGGIIGRLAEMSKIQNSYFIGDVLTRNDVVLPNQIEGYVGGIIGTPHSGIVNNCFVVTQIPNTIEYAGVITGTGGFTELVSNCYYKEYQNSPDITSQSCTRKNNSSFTRDEDTWILSTPPYINGSFYSDLVNALNAWVDENNSEGQYLHWGADTAGVNGGFPIFAEEDTKYIITFCNDDGTILQQDTLEFGEMPEYRGGIPTKDSTEQYNYTFIGWDQEVVPVTKDVTYYAQYETTLNQYEITFYDWDGELLYSDWVNYGAYPHYGGNVPWREADAQYTYTFTGWSPELSVVTGNQSYTAQYEATLNQYEVAFYDWDGTLLQSTMVNYGEWPHYYNSDPWRDADAQYSYTFTGWSPQLDIVTGHQSYYAQYESTLNQYEISFYNWDGTLLQSEWVNYGEMPTYTGVTPTREADAQYTYTFNGWSPQLDIVTGHQSYYAQYEATLNQYETNFYDWDGTLLQSSMVNYGEWPTYYNSEPTREADAQYTYNFTGWSPQLDIVTGHQSYYAQYEATLNQYEITFLNWDGEVLQSTMVDYGAMPEYFGVTPTKPEDDQYVYTFSGWEPEITIVVAYAEYTAQYDATDKVTTTIENTQSNEEKPYKVFYDDKIFIIRGDKVYSILGHVIEDWMPLGL